MKNYLVESMLQFYEMLDENEHELTEARNPENDIINDLIKKATYGKLGQNLAKALEPYGIRIDKERKILIGPNGRVLRMDLHKGIPQPQRDDDWSGMFGSTSEKHYMGRTSTQDNFDYLNYLTVNRDFEDKGRDFYTHYKIENPGEDTEIVNSPSIDKNTGKWDDAPGWKDHRSPESKALRPYSDEYKARAAEKQQAQDKVNAAKQELKQKNKDLKKFVADAKTRKNESLSLNEDIASVIPSFNDAFRKALKDVIWHGMEESEADRLVNGIVDATNLLLTDLLETITELDERITELENK